MVPYKPDPDLDAWIKKNLPHGWVDGELFEDEEVGCEFCGSIDLCSTCRDNAEFEFEDRPSAVQRTA